MDEEEGHGKIGARKGDGEGQWHRSVTGGWGLSYLEGQTGFQKFKEPRRVLVLLLVYRVCEVVGQTLPRRRGKSVRVLGEGVSFGCDRGGASSFAHLCRP